MLDQVKDMTTTNKVMALAFEYAFRVMEGGWPEDINLQAPLRSAVDTLVAERDALRTERDALRQVIEQQLLNVPVGEWKK